MRNVALYVLISVLIAISLTGCSGGDIQLVKKGSLQSDSTVTVGDALDNYKHFESTKWESFKSPDGRKVVEFRGVYNSKLISSKCQKDRNSKVDDLKSEIAAQKRELKRSDRELIVRKECKTAFENIPDGLIEEGIERFLNTIKYRHELNSPDYAGYVGSDEGKRSQVESEANDNRQKLTSIGEQISDITKDCNGEPELNFDKDYANERGVFKVYFRNPVFHRYKDVTGTSKKTIIDTIDNGIKYREGMVAETKKAIEKRESKIKALKGLDCGKQSGEAVIQFLVHTDGETFEIGHEGFESICPNGKKKENSSSSLTEDIYSGYDRASYFPDCFSN